MLCGWLDRTIFVLAGYAISEIVLTLNYFFVVNDFISLFLNLVQQMSDECLNKQWAISMLIFLLFSVYNELY